MLTIHQEQVPFSCADNILLTREALCALLFIYFIHFFFGFLHSLPVSLFVLNGAALLALFLGRMRGGGVKEGLRGNSKQIIENCPPPYPESHRFCLSGAKKFDE